MTATVAILAFDGMEVLDYAGPYEVFNVAGELSGGLFSVISVGVTATPVGRGGFAVLPSCTLEEAPSFDILVVPMGRGPGSLTRSAAPRVAAEHRRPGGSCCLGVYRSPSLGRRWLARRVACNDSSRRVLGIGSRVADDGSSTRSTLGAFF